MDASDDLAANLRNYEIQLQQVEAALSAGGGDGVAADQEELLKLKVDLEEVIKLTKDLMSGGPSAGKSSSSAGASHGHNYRAGEKVLAPWSEDGLYYEAILEEVMSDGQCNVTFCSATLGQNQSQASDEPPRKRKKGISEVCLVSLLKPCSNTDGSHQNYKKSGNQQKSGNKEHKSLSRDDLKKKQLKKQDRKKELEDEREKDKNKWQQFNQLSKKGSKKKVGLASAAGSSKSRVSIFKSPEGVDGRVGIGTCGISGKPMTPYTSSTAVGAPTTAGSVALHHSSFQKKKQQTGFTFN